MSTSPPAESANAVVDEGSTDHSSTPANAAPDAYAASLEDVLAAAPALSKWWLQRETVAGSPPVHLGLLDLRRRGVARHAEDLVEVSSGRACQEDEAARQQPHWGGSRPEEQKAARQQPHW